MWDFFPFSFLLYFGYIFPNVFEIRLLENNVRNKYLQHFWMHKYVDTEWFLVAPYVKHAEVELLAGLNRTYTIIKVWNNKLYQWVLFLISAIMW